MKNLRLEMALRRAMKKSQARQGAREQRQNLRKAVPRGTTQKQAP